MSENELLSIFTKASDFEKETIPVGPIGLVPLKGTEKPESRLAESCRMPAGCAERQHSAPVISPP